MTLPSRPETAAKKAKAVQCVLQHLYDEAEKLNEKLLECERQISWVKTHETWDEEVESLQIISTLEIRAEVLSDKVSEAQSLQASIREFFNMH